MPFLPQNDREWLESTGWDFQEVEGDGKRGVIVRDFPLLHGKFQTDHVSVLVMIPQGYPDAAPDMFWCDPALMLVTAQKQPNATNVSETHFGTTWQRWSRHYVAGQWRSGIDDLHAHFTMVRNSLRDAA